jgi:hypothetical protein
MTFTNNLAAHNPVEWKIETFNAAGNDPIAIAKVDVMRPNSRSDSDFIRWTYTLMVEVYESETGVNNAKDRACGYADCAILSAHPTPKPKYRLIDINEPIITPFGTFKVEWHSPTNVDHLKLTEIK